MDTIINTPIPMQSPTSTAAAEMLLLVSTDSNTSKGTIDDVKSYLNGCSSPLSMLEDNSASCGKWTNEQDTLLRQSVEHYDGRNWKEIARCIPGGRTDVQCLHRWQKVLKPGLIKGPWTKEEDDLVVELVNKYGGKKWSLIAMSLNGRLGKQCRERWYNHLDPRINKNPWTIQEDDLVMLAHHHFGSKWAELAKILPGRTDNSIKNRWNSTLEKISRKIYGIDSNDKNNSCNNSVHDSDDLASPKKGGSSTFNFNSSPLIQNKPPNTFSSPLPVDLVISQGEDGTVPTPLTPFIDSKLPHSSYIKPELSIAKSSNGDLNGISLTQIISKVASVVNLEPEQIFNSLFPNVTIDQSHNIDNNPYNLSNLNPRQTCMLCLIRIIADVVYQPSHKTMLRDLILSSKIGLFPHVATSTPSKLSTKRNESSLDSSDEILVATLLSSSPFASSSIENNSNKKIKKSGKDSKNSSPLIKRKLFNGNNSTAETDATIAVSKLLNGFSSSSKKRKHTKDSDTSRLEAIVEGNESCEVDSDIKSPDIPTSPTQLRVRRSNSGRSAKIIGLENLSHPPLPPLSSTNSRASEQAAVETLALLAASGSHM